MVNKTDLIADIVDNLRRVFHVVHEQSKKAKRSTGLTGPQIWTIKVIADSPMIKVSDLARRVYLHPATVVGILDRLETQGLVVRRRSEDDRRVVKVDLTRAGKLLVTRAPEVAQGLLVAGLEERTLTRLKGINSALKETVKILGAQELPPKLILSSEVNVPARKNGAKGRS
jgi:DNA-binding MarR family transcriptional regulator